MRTAWIRTRAWPRRIGLEEAEKLLAGEHVGADRRGLADLLSAAAGSAQLHELRGGEAPLVVFTQASHPVSPNVVSRRPVTVKLLSAKLAALTAVFVLGGAAVAAETGVLPSAAQQLAHDLFAGVGVPPPPAPQQPRSADDDDDPDDAATAAPRPSAKQSDDGDAAEALCHDYQESRGELDAKPMASAHAERLAALAGGAAKVERFCADVLGENGDPATESGPTRAPSPAPGPSDAGDE